MNQNQSAPVSVNYRSSFSTDEAGNKTEKQQFSDGSIQTITRNPQGNITATGFTPAPKTLVQRAGSAVGTGLSAAYYTPGAFVAASGLGEGKFMTNTYRNPIKAAKTLINAPGEAVGSITGTKEFITSPTGYSLRSAASATGSALAAMPSAAVEAVVSRLPNTLTGRQTAIAVATQAAAGDSGASERDMTEDARNQIASKRDELTSSEGTPRSIAGQMYNFVTNLFKSNRSQLIKENLNTLGNRPNPLTGYSPRSNTSSETASTTPSIQSDENGTIQQILGTATTNDDPFSTGI